MDKTLVKLAKSYSNGLMEQIYFMELIKESEVIPNDLEVAEVLVEKWRVVPVDDITFTNHNAAYELDLHLRELKY